MEPLVVFGAFLVVYCGYLAILDTLRDWKSRRLVSPAICQVVKKWVPVFNSECRPRSRAGFSVGRPFLNRV